MNNKLEDFKIVVNELEKINKSKDATIDSLNSNIREKNVLLEAANVEVEKAINENIPDESEVELLTVRYSSLMSKYSSNLKASKVCPIAVFFYYI